MSAWSSSALRPDLPDCGHPRQTSFLNAPLHVGLHSRGASDRPAARGYPAVSLSSLAHRVLPAVLGHLVTPGQAHSDLCWHLCTSATLHPAASRPPCPELLPPGPEVGACAPCCVQPGQAWAMDQGHHHRCGLALTVWLCACLYVHAFTLIVFVSIRWTDRRLQGNLCF